MNIFSFKKLLFLSFFSCLVLTFVLSFLNYEIPPWLWFVDLGGLFAFFSYYTLKKGMLTYVIKRTLGALVTLFIIATVTFVLLRTLPGGPFDQEKTLPPEIKANIEVKYHLDRPLLYQYGYYLSGLIQGDMGESYKYIGRNISSIMAETLPISIQLGVYALILSYLLGIPFGVLAASRHNTWADRFLMIGAISGVSLPSFLVAPLLILFFCFYLDWFETALWEGPSYYILPLLVLGTRPVSFIARLTRASVLEVIQSDYVRTAKAKGLHQWTVLYKHVLKNSFLPVLTFSGPLIAGILTGSFIVEHIFAIPGMAKHLVNSVTNRDYPLILGATLIYSTVLIFSNLIVDLLYSHFDPRIRLS